MNTLDWLINPIRSDDFFDQFFEQKPLLIQRSQTDYYDAVLSIDDIEQIMDLGQNIANFDVCQSASDGFMEDYTYSSVLQYQNVSVKTGIDKNKVRRFFQEQKCPIVISHVHNTWPRLKNFVDQLSITLDSSCYADLFITPPQVAKGFGIHFDLNDVCIMQLYGSKRWEVFESYGYLPDHPAFYKGFERDEAMHKKLFSIDLEAGSFLYLPRGFVHNVTTREQLSMHITIGCLNRKWSDVLGSFNADLALRSGILRQRLTPNSLENACHDLQEVRNTIETELNMKALESLHKDLIRKRSAEARPHIAALLRSGMNQAPIVIP